MIAHLHGLVSAVSPEAAIVDVGGVGLLVQCSPATLAQLRVGEDAQLATSLVVREDSLTLYGFADAEARALFEMLQTASGVGPRLAQAILAVHSPQTIRQALAHGEVTVLTQVPGVGKKGAQRLILELKDRIGPIDHPLADSSPAAQSSNQDTRDTVVEGLIALGWSAQQASQAAYKATATLHDELGPNNEPEVSQVLKCAIGLLGRGA